MAAGQAREQKSDAAELRCNGSAIKSIPVLPWAIPCLTFTTMMLQGLEEDRQQIQRAMNQLEDKTRSAIEFVFFKGLSRKECR